MLSELFSFMELGFRHIIDPAGMDHMLFVVVVAAIYTVRDWRGLVWVTTAFTVGHSLTLALAATGTVVLPSRLIEFLIPLTILATCLHNLWYLWHRGDDAVDNVRSRAVMAGFFGLIHGAGFANYLRELFLDRIVMPLLGFNLGLEVGQILILAVALCLFAAVDWAMRRSRLTGGATALRIRSSVVSAIAGTAAAVWSIERAPW